ncbi:MAG: hypothetical protein WBA48_17035 [Xanthobacteraceae bacterium]
MVTPEATPTIENAANLIERLRRTLLFSDLDCRCRDTLAAALDRFSALERRRLSRQGLSHARDHKDRIAAILILLSELDQMTEGEQDRSVFEEMALLFLEIASSAQAGAAVLRAIEDRQ